MHQYDGPDRRLTQHCNAHVETQERVARIETMIEVHNQTLARSQELAAQQAETLRSISICTDKLSKQLDAMNDKMGGFETRWNNRAVETDGVINEYRRAMISIQQRFEEGDRRMDMLEEINRNFEWFRDMVTKGRTKLIESFIFVVLLALLLTVTMQWQDIGRRLLKWVGM